jgi:lipid A biosynthesis acyltransferase
MINVVGDDWDSPIYEALGQTLPLARTKVKRHEQTLRVVLKAAGPMLHRFLVARGPHLRRVVGPEAELLFLDQLAHYYDRMGAILADGTAKHTPGWRTAVEALSRALAGNRPAIHITFQLGLPLVCPQLLFEATGRPVALVVHRNAKAMLDHLYRTSVKTRLLFLDEKPGAAMLSALHDGFEVLLNVDTVYPGTRVVTPVPFLGSRIAIPMGWRAIAQQARCEARPLVTLRKNRTLDVLTGPPIALSDDHAAATSISRFFEPLVLREPLQWLGWGSLEDNFG